MASEDILLMVPFVRHKKIDGSLYVMETRIGWIPEGKETFAISHNYTDIKMQKVSPADKPRIQLQVVLNDEGSTTFLFSNPEGKESQMKDREKVKDWLIQLLPKFKIKISKELEEKNRILKENPLVLQLYKELVIPEVVSSEVFWTEFAPPLIKVSEPEEKQVVGVSSGFLAEIKPQADGVNDLRVNLTKNMIDSIFRTYPAVQKKYEAVVPRKMTATSFWEKFIHSYYFRREREKDDIFNECAKTEDMDFVRDVRSGVKDPLSDLTRLVETEFVTDNESTDSQPSLFQPLLRRFTQHSVNVLKTTSHAKEATIGENGGVITHNGQPGLETYVVPSKKARLHEATEIDDLEGGPLPDEALIAKSKLKINRVDRYLNGPTVSTEINRKIDNPLEALNVLEQSLLSWCMGDSGGRGVVPVTSTASTMALRELSIGGKLMSCSALDSIAANISEEIQNELRELYRAACELLRHFWSALTTQQPGGDEKILIVFESLINFQKKKLKPFEDKQKAQRESADAANITRHLQCLLQIADKKFKRWDEMRQK